MAANQSVDQRGQSRNSGQVTLPPQHTPSDATEMLTPRHGVVTLFGYGIKIRMDRGHLIVDDGIGAARREARLPRVGHGLKRLVVIGADGMVSLAALRWLADQDAAFVMLNRNGSVLATTGPVRPTDARLHRAQARADQSETGLRIVRELIGRKLAGQEQVAREKLCNSAVAQTIADLWNAVASAETIQSVRLLEAQAGAAYWSAWHVLPIPFPRNDLRRVPEHWRTFGSRRSPLSGSPRQAANPANAILNYLYTVLESEARLAAASLGLHPGLGILHCDKQGRDSLACDLMEPVRPQVDSLLLDWLANAPLRREWFFEERDGTCRLMGSFAEQLSQTAPTWKRAVVPFAEAVARALWVAIAKPSRELTQVRHGNDRN
jgi:CRISPR-associated endonuclease Cas1